MLDLKNDGLQECWIIGNDELEEQYIRRMMIFKNKNALVEECLIRKKGCQMDKKNVRSGE